MLKYLLVGISLVTVGITAFILFYNPTIKVGEFKLEDYIQYIDYFPSNKQVSSVDDAKTAVAKAKQLWVETFSKPGRPYDYKRFRPYQVFYDDSTKCWYVRGTLRNSDGGVPNALIQTDGKVLAVWHSM